MSRKRKGSKKLDGAKAETSVADSYSLVCVASTRERPKRPDATESLVAVPRSEKKAMFACGHEDFEVFIFDVWGEPLELADDYMASKTKCSPCQLDDIKRTFIRCAYCGHAIRPGDPVVSYADDPRFNPLWKTLLGEGDRTYVLGCLTCSPSAGFFSGHWDGQRHVGLFESGAAKLMRQSDWGKDGYIGGYFEEPLGKPGRNKKKSHRRNKK